MPVQGIYHLNGTFVGVVRKLAGNAFEGWGEGRLVCRSGNKCFVQSIEDGQGSFGLDPCEVEDVREGEPPIIILKQVPPAGPSPETSRMALEEAQRSAPPFSWLSRLADS